MTKEVSKIIEANGSNKRLVYAGFGRLFGPPTKLSESQVRQLNRILSRTPEEHVVLLGRPTSNEDTALSDSNKDIMTEVIRSSAPPPSRPPTCPIL